MVREYDPGDIEAVAELIAADWASFHHETDGGWIRELLSRYLETGERHIWLAESEERFVGLLELSLEPTYKYRGQQARIELLYVDESMRGTGVGSALMRAAMSYCDANGIVEVKVETEPENLRAQALYKRHGLTEQQVLLMRDTEHKEMGGTAH